MTIAQQPFITSLTRSQQSCIADTFLVPLRSSLGWWRGLWAGYFVSSHESTEQRGTTYCLGRDTALYRAVRRLPFPIVSRLPYSGPAAAVIVDLVASRSDQHRRQLPTTLAIAAGDTDHGAARTTGRLVVAATNRFLTRCRRAPVAHRCGQSCQRQQRHH